MYDPAQASIEAQSVKACMEKYNASSDADFKVRATIIKEERADLVKHHLWVLWTDYFKVDHLKAYPNLHDLFWMATKTAGEAKKTNDVTVADRLLERDRRHRRDLLGDQEVASEARHSSPGKQSCSAQFGVRGTVRQQRVLQQFGLVDLGTARLTRPVGTTAQTLECPVHVVERVLDRHHALVTELAHASQVTR